MVFLHELVAMTNYCNLKCSYCDWPKEKIKKLSADERRIAKHHLEKTRVLGDKLFGEFQLIGYTGGEPLLYKDLVFLLLDIYHDKWVRINTNGLLIDFEVLNYLKSHGKSYLAVSLDGNSFEDNKNRFSTKSEFNKVLKNIDIALEHGVCVQIMDTMNPLNIDRFLDYAQWLSEKYADFIADGSLIMCAHFIQTYSKKRAIPTPEQRECLADKLMAYNVPEIISKAHWHYQRLAKYLLTLSNEGCTAIDWARCTHFIGRDLVTSGDFKTFACGMYGKVEGERLNINDLNIVDSFRRIHNEIYDKFSENNSHGRCITDWNAIDSIINGNVGIIDAQNWFKMFRDEKIVLWLEQEKSNVINSV
jgi:sulfatase maturation enzyme AslB (radical SAM superfamily)